MELTPVSSTNIHAMGYDPEAMSLQLQFKNGDVYAYANVAPDVYASMQSGDIGRYFSEIIRPQRFTMPFTKLGNLPLV